MFTISCIAAAITLLGLPAMLLDFKKNNGDLFFPLMTVTFIAGIIFGQLAPIFYGRFL